MTVTIKVEIDCDIDTGMRIRDLIDRLLEKNIEPKYRWIKSAKTTIIQT